jgi:hypothetical protein
MGTTCEFPEIDTDRALFGFDFAILRKPQNRPHFNGAIASLGDICGHRKRFIFAGDLSLDLTPVVASASWRLYRHDDSSLR